MVCSCPSRFCRRCGGRASGAAAAEITGLSANLLRPPQVNEGLVVAVGPGRRTKEGELMPVSVKEGDKVLLPEYGGNQVKLGDKE